MNKRLLKYGCLAASLLWAGNASSQLSNTLYFNDYNPRQHKVNPAVQPELKFYVGMPGLSTIAASAGNSRFTFDDIFQNVDVNGERKTVLFLDENSDGLENFLDKLKYKERVYAAYQVDLIDFGFKMRHNNFLTVSLSNRFESMAIVPHQIPSLFLRGMEDGEAYDLRANKLSANASLYTELAVGYSQKLNNKLNVGGAFKLLFGHDNLHSCFKDLEIVGSDDSWYIKGDASVYSSFPGLHLTNDEEGRIHDVTMDEDVEVKEYLRIKGSGMSVDFGATYQLLDQLKLSASVQDLGFIRWKKNLSQIKKVEDFVFDGITYKINGDSLKYFEKYGEQIEHVVTAVEDPKPYTTSLCAKLNVGAEYSLFNNKLGLGFLSKTFFYQRTAWEQLILSANYRPSRWVSLTATYGIFDGEWNNIGLGANFNLGPVNLNFAVDNIPVRYGVSGEYTYPSNTRNIRAMAGLAFVFRDVIRDRDGDGVPNKLDKCPKTPAAAYGYVDKKGCPKDSDRDGVPDYLDRCPDTPLKKVGKVDSLGCPIDSDGDGVADYLDKCPNTPAAAIGSVDSLGCEKDSDGDGIPDYLDKCPNEPTDPSAKVDSLGCPIDSDGDGVADYLDKCPDVAGTAENGGCPAVTKDVAKVFKKALNGIQFQTGKAIITKSSYGILNQVVTVMNEHPEYELNITGHTDAVGNPDRNMELSIDRAAAVKDYLVKKGIDDERIAAYGKGDTEPIATNDTEAGRSKNRRVELEAEFQEAENK